jgi:hypothetical protein
MKRTTWGFLAVLLATSPAISYFKYERQLGAASASGQHYVVVDETLWQHALLNLDDLRLYAAGKEFPYALRTMRGTRESEQKAVRLLQPGAVGGENTVPSGYDGSPRI